MRRPFCFWSRVGLCAILGLLVVLGSSAVWAKDFGADRVEMIHDDLIGRGIRDSRTLDAMFQIPREAFVPTGLRWVAYADRPLPIGYGQTISQPYIVALMTETLQLDPTDRVLEIGTGSGYQAAVLAELVAEVFTVEIIEPLGESAQERLNGLGYTNVRTLIGDGYFGWPDQQPFDAIIVTAAASHIPPPLLDQLKPGGRMVIPVGSVMQVQQLLLVQKDLEGRITQQSILPVRFVPLTRGSEENQ